MERRIRAGRSTALAALLIFAAGLFAGSRQPAAVASSPQHATARTRVAQVRYIHKGLTVLPPPHRSKVKGKIEMPLYGQDELRTAAAEIASLGFQDGTLLHLNQRTDAVLRSASLTYVNSGEVEEVLSPGTNHVIQTPAATATAIGTDLDIRYHPSLMTVIVVEGAVLVQNKQGSVVVKTGQQTTVRPGHAPASPVPANAAAATSWARSIPPPATPVPFNVSLDANGGAVTAFSSEASPPGSWDAIRIIDGHLDSGWASAEGKTAGEWVKFSLGGSKSYTILGVVVDPAATGGLPSADDLTSFQILVSTSGTADADFHSVLTAQTQPANRLQLFAFPAEPATYVELKALSNNGGSRVGVAELEVLASSGPVAIPTSTSTAVPTDTITPTSSPTPSATSTATLSATPTVTPTATVTSTATVTPTVTLTLSTGFSMSPNPATVLMSFSPTDATAGCTSLGNSFQANFRIAIAAGGNAITIDQPGNANFIPATGTVSPNGSFSATDGSFTFTGQLRPDASGGAILKVVENATCTLTWSVTWAG